MSDVETLVATFQTQLSDVMETVLKTAMYEVTKLVEDGFMEQLRLRSHDAESLRLQLRWTEEKLRDGGRRCVTCGKAGVDVAEDGPGDTGYGVLDGCSPKRETNSPDALGSCRQGAMPKAVSTHAADEPTCIVTPMRDARETEDSVKPHAKMKVEEDDLPSCSVEQQEGWPRAPDGGAVSTFHRPNEVADSQPNQTLRSSKDISRTAIRQDLPTSAPSTFTTDREDPVPLLDSKSAYLTLTTDDTLSLDNEPTFPRGSPKQKGLKQVHLEPIYKDNCNSQHYMPHIPSKAKNDISSVGDVVVKQEILVDSCGDEDEDLGKKEVTLSTKAFSSSSVNKHNARPEVIKQKQISHEPAAQEVIKKHAKMGSSLTFKAAVQHLQPPMTKPHQTHSTTTSTARSLHFNPLNRTPSTSKSAPPPLSAPQAHLSAKQSMVLNRTGSPWVNIKTNYQTANSHQNPGSHPHHQQGPRNFLRCGLCGKCFPHPSNLKAHLQTHTGERPFCCSLCGRSFTKLSNLKAHRRVHTGERPYCCLACGKRFTQKCNLKRHQRIHMDV